MSSVLMALQSHCALLPNGYLKSDILEGLVMLHLLKPPEGSCPLELKPFHRPSYESPKSHEFTFFPQPHPFNCPVKMMLGCWLERHFERQESKFRFQNFPFVSFPQLMLEGEYITGGQMFGIFPIK